MSSTSLLMQGPVDKSVSSEESSYETSHDSSVKALNRQIARMKAENAKIKRGTF